MTQEHTPSLSSFRELTARNAHERRRKHSIDKASHLLRQADMAMHELIGDEKWDPFLAMVKQMNEDDEAQAASIRSLIDSTAYISPEKLVSLRQQLSIFRARIEARQQVMEVPKTIAEASSQTSKSPT